MSLIDITMAPRLNNVGEGEKERENLIEIKLVKERVSIDDSQLTNQEASQSVCLSANQPDSKTANLFTL